MGGNSAGSSFGAWLAGTAHMAAAMAAMAEGFAVQTGESDAAEEVWAALDAQAGLWRAQARALSGTAQSAAGRETLERFLDPAQWLFGGGAAPDPALAALIEGPDPATLSVLGREALRTCPEWVALRRARARHRVLVAGAWRRCFDRFAAEARDIADPDAVPDRWVALAGAELDALHASEAFAASMHDLVMAAVALREAEAKLVEAFCESHGLPTRREIDDLHRTVTDLRRELRSLRRSRGER